MRRCSSSPSVLSPRDPPTPSGQLTALDLEYSRTVQTLSFKETWHRIHSHDGFLSVRFQSDGCRSEQTELELEQEEGPATPPSSPLNRAVLLPGREEVAAALGGAPRSPFTELAAAFFDATELASALSLSLQSAVGRARGLYAPLHALLDAFPPADFSVSQCSDLHAALRGFHSRGNPFVAPSAPSHFEDLRGRFDHLRKQLASLLEAAGRRRAAIRRMSAGSAVALLGTTAALAVVAAVVATHGAAAVVVAPAAAAAWTGQGRRGGGEEVRMLEDAVSQTFVGGFVDTMGPLAMRLRDIVESDRSVVENFGLRSGAMKEIVVENFRKTREDLRRSLQDLEEHVCVCCNEINRARSALLHHVARHRSPAEDGRRRR